MVKSEEDPHLTAEDIAAELLHKTENFADLEIKLESKEDITLAPNLQQDALLLRHYQVGLYSVFRRPQHSCRKEKLFNILVRGR